jgi:hypothetical protein
MLPFKTRHWLLMGIYSYVHTLNTSFEMRMGLLMAHTASEIAMKYNVYKEELVPIPLL